MLGLVVCASAWFVLIFVRHDVFFSANHVLYFEPLSRFVGESLRDGRIPLWNPYCYSGMSQIANLTPSPFYPFTGLFAVLDYNYAVAISIIIHELIGLGGTYLLLRMMGTPATSGSPTGDAGSDGNAGSEDGSARLTCFYSRMACLTGALAFMFCGCLQPGPANFTIAATAAWIPWCFWAQMRLQRADGRAALAGGVAVLAIVAAMNMLAGCIELSMLTMGIVKFNVILDAVKRYRAGKPWFRNALRQWCALLLGTLMAAPALLPATEWSIDKLQFSVGVAAASRADALTTLLGFLYPIKQSGFTIIAALLIDGKGTGELIAVDHVITCFGPIVLALAAFGLTRAAQHRRFLIAAMLVGTAALCLVSLRTLDLPLARFLPSPFLCHPTAPFMVLMSALMSIAVTEGVSAIQISNSRYSLFALIAVVLSLVPCSYFNVDGFCTTARNVDVVLGPDTSKDYKDSRMAISARWAIPQLVSGPNEQVVDTFARGKEANRNVDDALLNACGYQSTPSPAYQYIVVGKKFSHPQSLQALTAATIVARPRPLDANPPSKHQEADVDRYSQSVSSRCSATNEWTWKDSQTQALEAIRDENFLANPSFIERKTAQGKDADKLRELPSGLLNPPAEAPSASPEKETLSTTEESALHGKVELTQSDLEHVVVSVVLDKPAFVILRDAFYPGWKVSIDAIPTTCYRANGVDRAVYVDKGPHLIQFDFKPDSYALGLKCFVMGLAVFFYLVIWSIARLIVKTIRFMSYGVWEQ